MVQHNAILFGGILALFVVSTTATCSRKGGSTPFTTRQDVESSHGLKLPSSADHCQQLRCGGILDHGILAMFEIESTQLQEFLAQLKVTGTQKPVATGAADPRVNGFNVWPKTASTFVPGNKALDGLQLTWSGEAKPIQMLSCRSPKGDWLHVEVWTVGHNSLIKLYTDWN